MGEAAERMPLISVIVPVYNVESYLRNCVESILAQTYTNLEIILVDDGSTDNCPAICDEYAKMDSRIKVIHKENGGVSSARNKGLQVISGEYVAFVDSDDYINLDYFMELSKYDADVVVSEAYNTSGLHCIDDIKENYYNWGGFSGPVMKLYKCSAIDGIQFREDLSVGEDIIFNLKVLQKINTAWYIPYRGYNIVDNPASLTRRKSQKYDERLDEEYQCFWGKIHSVALLEAGISQALTDETNKRGCSVWIYQKIKNYCYSDCPHIFSERIRRIKRQLEGNRDDILKVNKPLSPKTHLIIKFCVLMRSSLTTYAIFRLLVLIGK